MSGWEARNRRIDILSIAFGAGWAVRLSVTCCTTRWEGRKHLATELDDVTAIDEATQRLRLLNTLNSLQDP